MRARTAVIQKVLQCVLPDEARVFGKEKTGTLIEGDGGKEPGKVWLE